MLIVRRFPSLNFEPCDIVDQSLRGRTGNHAAKEVKRQDSVLL